MGQDTCALVHEKSENNLLCPSMMWVLGIKVRLSDLEANTFAPETSHQPMFFSFSVVLVSCWGLCTLCRCL